MGQIKRLQARGTVSPLGQWALKRKNTKIYCESSGLGSVLPK